MDTHIHTHTHVSAELWQPYFTCSLFISLRASMCSFLSCSISSRSSKSDREFCWQERSRNYFFHLRRDPRVCLKPNTVVVVAQLSEGHWLLPLTDCKPAAQKIFAWHNQSPPTDRYQSNHMMRMDQRGVTSRHITSQHHQHKYFNCCVQNDQMFVAFVSFLGRILKLELDNQVTVTAGLPDGCWVNPTNRTTWTENQ